MALIIILAIVFAILGAAAFEWGGLLFGGILGFLVGTVLNATSRLNQLEAQMKVLRMKLGEQTVPPPVETNIPREAAPSVVEVARPATPPAPPIKAPVHAPPIKTAAPATALPTQVHKEDIFDRLSKRIMGFFTDGNVFAKVGLIILFFGVGFLVKYAAERNYFPVEVRFIVAAMIGIGLLVIGWRLRHSKTLFGLLLQGGGVGVLYVTVFAAAKLFSMLPLGLALAIMIALVAFSAMLAILQNAKYLALFGAAGGFLAPILTSTGSGNHVMLFSYYALLNLGIVSIAWYRSWRELNLLGFVFTFIIGLTWGINYYQPAYFNSVEPFLILFFLFFVTIAVLFAVRQPPQLKGYVDGTLVFGVPVVAFALQTSLIKNIEYGLAFSALGMSALYIALALSLWQRAAQGLRLLTEAFLALGVVFGTLAIPLALDGHWTSAAWALEGAAIIWVGVRQQRLLARLFGIFLQLASGVAYFSAMVRFDRVIQFVGSSNAQWVVFNSTYLGAVLISLAGLFSSYYLYKHREQLHEAEAASHVFLLVWGLLWWLGAGHREILNYLEVNDHLKQVAASLLLFVTASAVLLQRVAQRLVWPPARYPVLGLIGIMYVALLLTHATRHSHPFDMLGSLAWAAAFAAQYFILYQYRQVARQTTLQWQHVLTFWLLVYLLSWEAAWLMREVTQGSTWQQVMWGVIPALMLSLLFALRIRLRWPLTEHYAWYLVTSGSLLVLWLWLCMVGFSALSPGNPWPLEIYVPLLNPLELAVIFMLLVILRWAMEFKHVDVIPSNHPLARWVLPGSAFAGFVLINGIVARSVHHWLDVPYTFAALNHSVEFHTALSVIWTITALTITFIATRLARREFWYVGAALLGAVVVKLFLVELASSGTLARIISFITVGILLLLINHFSPIPPRKQEAP
jgi:uncharacterized membrane protein